MHMPINDLNIKTPFYYYDMGLLNETLCSVKNYAQSHNYHVHYAVKANANDKILQRIQKYGLGADCVSGNEILTALKNGFAAKKIVFAGVGKSDEEIEIALDNDILCFNSESYQELEVINEIAISKGKRANIALRITPNIESDTHHYITTGKNENKFGFKTWEIDKVLLGIKNLKNLNFIGLHFHIGSQITNLEVFKNLSFKINDILANLKSNNISISYLNLGGGLGINYEEPSEQLIPEFENYFSVFANNLILDPNIQVHFELGRSIVGQFGSLITKVLYTKPGQEKNFLIVDAGMTELLRPALYNAQHKIENISQKDSLNYAKYEVAGPICETSDSFGKNIILPESKRGDILMIKSAGAYGEVMASAYNQRTRVSAYYSDEQDITAIQISNHSYTIPFCH